MNYDLNFDVLCSLSQALYDPAVEYYTAHSKRVRRKRNRHSTTVSSYPNPSVGNIVRPLRPEGWTVRYEYKMACFAEFRGEDEVALKWGLFFWANNTCWWAPDIIKAHTICWSLCLALPQFCPHEPNDGPRRKYLQTPSILRFELVLTNRLYGSHSEQITKLYLYNNEHSLALSHHSTHIRKFGDFSRGWGIGEETFEFWSWIARQ